MPIISQLILTIATSSASPSPPEDSPTARAPGCLPAASPVGVPDATEVTLGGVARTSPWPRTGCSDGPRRSSWLSPPAPDIGSGPGCSNARGPPPPLHVVDLLRSANRRVHPDDPVQNLLSPVLLLGVSDYYRADFEPALQHLSKPSQSFPFLDYMKSFT